MFAEFSQRVALVEKDANNTDTEVVHAARMRKFETEKQKIGKVLSQMENEENLLHKQREGLGARNEVLQVRGAARNAATCVPKEPELEANPLRCCLDATMLYAETPFRLGTSREGHYAEGKA